MNDIRKTVSTLVELVNQLPNAHRTIDKAGLYAAIRLLTDDIRNADDSEVNGYAKEKAHKLQWHAAAALGFDIDNGHSAEQHRSWALGEVGTLESVVE